MSNPFITHGIEHLSPSTCNLFQASPAMFVLEKIMKRRQPVGCAAYRGSSVESGISHGLTTGSDDDECVQVAQLEFAQRAALSADPAREKEAAALDGMVRQGLAELRGYGRPSALQERVEHKVEGLDVPIIGFFDFEWSDHGILTDLKTTHAIPSKVKSQHARQVALYAACRGGNTDVRISYVSTKKSATYSVENIREHLAALERVAFTIQRFLAVSSDPDVLASIVIPDTDSFYFADPLARAAAFDVWKI